MHYSCEWLSYWAFSSLAEWSVVLRYHGYWNGWRSAPWVPVSLIIYVFSWSFNPLESLTFLHCFFQLFATCTPCVHSSSFQEILLLGWNLKNGEHHPERTFLPFTYPSYIIASLPCKILTHLLWDILCTDFLLSSLCAFCFMSDFSPGSYRDLNLRAQLSLSALLLTRTSVVHLLWQAQALLALAQTHWIAALHCRNISELERSNELALVLHLSSNRNRCFILYSTPVS